MDNLPVMRPQLPAADQLLPYLRRIDAHRLYTNFGPLVQELEARLAAEIGLPAGTVLCTSSGTTALIGAILAAAGRATTERPFALMPAYTFVATAAAAQACGYQPCLLDIDEESWLLNAERAETSPVLARAGLVIPVAAYGRPVEQSDWLSFQSRTGIPVVIDGAAAFESVSRDPDRFAGLIPVVSSFHATKSFSTGEGGCVTCVDAGFNVRAAQALNFGFHMTRNSGTASTNGKMSEYHAAVGLAELDDWVTKRTAFFSVAELYRERLNAVGLQTRLAAAPDISSCYAVFRCLSVAESLRVRMSLERHSVDYRLWYGFGLQSHAYYADVPRHDLSTTAAVAPCLLGLPMATDMVDADVSRVVAALIEGTVEAAPPRVALVR